MNETDEIARTVSLDTLYGLETMDQARIIAKRIMPTEGYVLIDNMAWSLLQRAPASRKPS